MKAAAAERASELSWSGYEPVAVIGKEPEELAIGRTLAFEERYDDLDSMRECTFAGPSGAKFGLMRYLHAPRPGGTQLLVKARSLAQATELLAEATAALDLTMPDLIWIRRELWAGMSAATEKREAERKAKSAKDEARRAGRAGKKDESPSVTPDLGRVKADAALAKVVGSGQMSRKEITKKLWSYIKRKGLQDKQNRRMINADDALRPVFGGKPQVSMEDLPKLVDKRLKSGR